MARPQIFKDIHRLSYSLFEDFKHCLLSSSSSLRPLLASILSQPVSTILSLTSLSPTSPVLLTWFLYFWAALLMFWWPGPHSFAHLFTLTEVLLSPTTSQTLRATTLYQPSCCFSLSLYASVSFNPSFVSVLLCSVLNTDGHPAISNAKLFSLSTHNTHVELVGPMDQGVWVYQKEKFNKCYKSTWVFVDLAHVHFMHFSHFWSLLFK